MEYFGEFIALSTILCWTLSVQLFEAASKRIGALPVNIIRISVALFLFTGLLYIREGALIPLHFPMRAWVLLSLSGVIGFFIGDIFLFKALVEIGPRVAMLIQSLGAPSAAVIGWLFLAESYSLFQWIGMLVTLAGVALVVFDRDKKVSSKGGRKVRQISFAGICYGFLGMMGQAVGLVLSKEGMAVSDTIYLDAFASTQIRAIAACICFILFFTVTKKWTNVQKGLANKQALTYTAIGAIVGPFLGVSLSLYTLHYLAAGIALTFFSLIPICIIPFSYFLHKEYVSVKAILGALIAVSGVYMLIQ